MTKLYVFEGQTPDCEYDLIVAVSLEKALEYHATEHIGTTSELTYFKGQTFIKYTIASKGSDGRIYYGTWSYGIKEYFIKEGIL